MNRRISKFKFLGFVLALLVLSLAILLTACNNNSTENIGIENKVFSSEGILFSYNFKTGSNEVTGYIGSAKYVVIPSMYQSRKVTCINPDAFAGCSGIIEIKIEEGIEYIGWNSFRACSGLTSITIPDSVTFIADAFDRCFNLESVTIGKGVTKIDLLAFRGCSIKNVYYTGDIAGWCGIDGLSALMKYSPSLYIGGKKITDKITIPDSVTSISNAAFEGCTELTSITIPDSVTSIDESAFSNTIWYNNQPDGMVYAGKVAYKYKGTMPANMSITIKDGTLGIGGFAFSNCKELTNVTIPNSVKSICNGAFNNCTGLRSVTIPDRVTSIGEWAFKGCTGLTSITIPDRVTSIAAYAFSGCTGLTSVTIPDSVTSIGKYAFRDCSSLTSITIPDRVTSIEKWAFRDCSSLASITIPDSVESIWSGAFYNCTGLTSVTIGSGVRLIAHDVFRYCENLNTVYNKSSLSIKAGSSSNGYVAYYAKNVYNVRD